MSTLLRKPSNCSCDGNFRENGHRWVVLKRREKSSHLKCLDCGWKWWSGCKYVADLPDHVEQSRSGMTDQDILDKINDGRLAVLPDEARVFSFGRNQWAELKVRHRESNGSTYSFVEVCANGKKKKVALHRLVWMFANRRLVPDGFDVDHIEGKVSDSIDNLRLLESSKNRSIGKPEVSETRPLPF